MGILNIFKTQPPSVDAPESKFRVLITDDDDYIREFYQELLTENNYDVITATNGQECLQLVAQYFPDLILLDIMMPVLDGMKTLEKLQVNPQTAQIPVLILTNAGSMSNMEQARINSAFGFLIKANSSPEEVLQKVKEPLIGKTPHIIPAPAAPTQNTPTK
jgi:CheY-like chemotaxis protein